MSDALVVCALACTGLYAGYLLAFQSGVMPAFRTLPDDRFTETMREVNRKVPGPLFLLLFLGSVGLPTASWFVAPEGRDDGAQLLVAVAAGCAAVGHLVTAAGNVPLNSALEAARDRGGQQAARQAFEGRWNALHAVRTLFAVVAFVLMSASTL
ncbi:anthrone oxygenase family protein [Streptomyces sp. NPDC054765]